MYHFGLDSDQFWRLTLREFSHLAERHKESEEIADRRVGRIMSMLANVNRDPSKRPEPYTEEDFIPRPPPPPQTPEQQAEVFKMIAAMVPRR